MKHQYELAHTKSNQSLVNEYEGVVQFYLDVREDNFWHDDFYPAWKDDRVGGLRESMIARKQAAQELTLHNFEEFKKKRLEELSRYINESTDQKVKSSLTREYNLLKQSTSYREFGQKIGTYDAFKTNIHISNASDNKEQVNWTLNHIDSTIKQRYDMMQGIAFAVSDGMKLPTIKSRVQTLSDDIMKGLNSYESEKNKGVYLTQSGRDEYRDGLSFNYIRKYAQQAIGISESYEDAVQAMMNSPVYDLMRQYYLDKAQKENDKLGAAHLKSGNYEDLILYGKDKGFIRTKPSYFSHLLRGTDHDNVKNLVIPSLQRLEKAEDEYNFISQLFNEFNIARQKNPDLIKQLQKVEIDKRFINLDLNNSRETEIAHKTVTGLADLMVQRGAVSEGIWEGTKTAAMLAAFTAISVSTGGLGLVGTVAVGAGLGATGYCLDQWGPTATAQESIKNWLDDTWINQEFSHIKNSHIMKQMKQIISHQYMLAAQSREKLQHISEDDFDHAIAYGLKNSPKKEHDMLVLINEARLIAALPKEEQEKYIAKHQAACQENLKQLEKNPNDYDLLMKQQDLAKEIIKIKCAQTGNYFYYAKLGTDILSDVTNKNRKEHIKLYCGEEAELLSEVSKAMDTRISTEMELHNRQLIIDQWKKAGQPIIQLEAADYGIEDNNFEEDDILFLDLENNKSEDSSVPIQTDSQNNQQLKNIEENDEVNFLFDDHEVPQLDFSLNPEQVQTQEEPAENNNTYTLGLDDNEIPQLSFSRNPDQAQTQKTLSKNSQQLSEFDANILFTHNTQNG